MDPDETLRRFVDAVARADSVDEWRDDSDMQEQIDHLWDAVQAAQDIFLWMHRGGRAPEWSIAQETS